MSHRNNKKSARELQVNCLELRNIHIKTLESELDSALSEKVNKLSAAYAQLKSERR